MANWAELDQNLLIEIVERLPSQESHDSFGRVCKSWEAAAGEGHPNQTIFEVPWLMFAEKVENNKKSSESKREFSSVSLGIQRIRKIFLPEASKQRCVSCKDWLLVTSPDEIDASLLHPLSRVQIHLPKLTTLSFYDNTGVSHFIEKAVLSTNPTTNSDYIVMVLCGRQFRLGFWKSGDTSWTSIDDWKPSSFEDIIYSNNDNKLYGLDQSDSIISCDIHGPNPSQLVKVFGNLPDDVDCPAKSYLVELSREKFLLVRKYVFIDDNFKFYHTERFKVFEVNIEDGTWMEVKDLGCKAIFVGYNTSYIIACSEFNKCKPNCIYFSDDYSDAYLLRGLDGGSGGGKDMGIYRLSDGSIRPFFDEDIVRSRITPPTWIGPSF